MLLVRFIYYKLEHLPSSKAKGKVTLIVVQFTILIKKTIGIKRLCVLITGFVASDCPGIT